MKITRTQLRDISALIFVVAITISVFYIIIPIQQEELQKFRQEAEEHLGTKDFTIYVTDIVIAKTEDGKQYPSEEVVSTYYARKLTFLGILSVVGLGIIAFTPFILKRYDL